MNYNTFLGAIKGLIKGAIPRTRALGHKKKSSGKTEDERRETSFVNAKQPKLRVTQQGVQLARSVVSSWFEVFPPQQVFPSSTHLIPPLCVYFSIATVLVRASEFAEALPIFILLHRFAEKPRIWHRTLSVLGAPLFFHYRHPRRFPFSLPSRLRHLGHGQPHRSVIESLIQSLEPLRSALLPFISLQCTVLAAFKGRYS
jgi:hypothetical protein